MKCTFLQIFKGFYMNNHLQKSSAPFRPFFGIFEESSAANFSGRTNFCRAPFELCGRNFGPLATLCTECVPALEGYDFKGSKLIGNDTAAIVGTLDRQSPLSLSTLFLPLLIISQYSANVCQ
jgi:hypothetical protein